MRKTLYFATFLTVTSMLVTIIAYLGYEATQPRIIANRNKKIDDNIALIYDPDDGYQKNEDQAYNTYREKNRNYDVINEIYEVLDGNGEIHALIYDMTSEGRNGPVSALIAVNPFTKTVEAVVYYKHSETPNIGERYTREEEISKLIGQSINNYEIDLIAGASTTWGAIDDMFAQLKIHFNAEVNING